MTCVRVALLGYPAIERHGVPVQVDTRKAVALLAYLLVRERPQSRDALASLLWPDYDESSARAALRRTLTTLRSAIGSEVVQSDRHAVRVRRTLVDVDLDRLLLAVETARAHGHDPREACETCLPILDGAASARGDFLEGFSVRDAPEFEDWQLLEAQSVRQQLAHVLEGASAGHARLGDFDRALGHAERWLALDPLHEPAHRALMRLYSSSGQRPAALRQYRECVRILQEELAVSPAEETTELYRSIREHDELPAVSHTTAATEIEPPDERLPLTGRDVEWNRLIAAFQSMVSRGYVVALEGEAGIGKTRLMEELLHHARARGAVAMAARCYEGEREVPYAPIVQLLRAAVGASGRMDSLDLSEVARLLPEFAGTHRSVLPLDSPGAHTRFLEGLVASLLTPADTASVLLAVDDVQWADTSSIACLLYLLHRLGGRSAGLVLTWRTEDVPSAHLLRRAVLETERDGGGELMQLGRLDRASVAALVETTQAHPAEALSAQLFAETEGIPLFIDEYLALIARGSRPDVLPRGVRATLESRLASVSDVGRQFLAVAAVIGRSFDFDTLREASGRDEEMAITALEELTAQGLVKETGERPTLPSYDFSHDKLRALVYEETSLPRRRLLHRRVAEVLLARFRRPGNDSLAALIAQHYAAAGMQAEAATYHAEAAAHARALYANREAIAHLEAALALGQSGSDTYEALGDLHALLGEYRAAVSRYESAAALCDGLTAARIEHKLGIVHDRWGEWELADAYYEAALTALDSQDVAGWARILVDRAMVAHHRGDDTAARRLADEALDLARDGQDTLALARVHTVLGILAASGDELPEATRHLEESLRYAAELTDPAARIATLHNLALVASRQGDLQSAAALAGDALARAGAQGDRHREAALHNVLADLLHSAGDGDAAMEHLKRAVSIYAEIGVESGSLRPEVWKLAEW